MFRSRVAEFEGAEAFLEAADTVLREPYVDLAVVRNVDGLDGLGGGEQTSHSMDSLAYFKEFKKVVPQAKKIREVINPFWDDYVGALDSTIRPSAKFTFWQTVEERSERHVDPEDFGPLTISARIDTHDDLRRTFHARKKVGKVGISLDGIPTIASNYSGVGLGRLGLTRADQNPGDIILFANFPFVTAHKTRAREESPISYRRISRRPKVLILSTRLHNK